jgi:hypothetical protein
MAEMKRLLVPIVESGESMASDVVLVHDGGTLELGFDVRVGMTLLARRLVFTRVRAFRWRAESHSTPWHIEDVYGRLAEVIDSEWVAELRKAEPELLSTRWEIHHYMIYLEDSGAYEVACEKWERGLEDGVGDLALRPK